MTWRVEISNEALKQFQKLPAEGQARIGRAFDEFEERPERQWSNVKALQGPEWKGRFRKKVGPYRIIFETRPSEAKVWVSAILLRSKDTYS